MSAQPKPIPPAPDVDGSSPFDEWLSKYKTRKSSINPLELPYNDGFEGKSDKKEEDFKSKFMSLCKAEGFPTKLAEEAFAKAFPVLAKAAKSGPSAKESWKTAAKGERILQPGWPTETYAEAHRAHGWNIVRFLEERYADLIERGEVTRVKLRAHDPSADMAVNNYMRGGRVMPSHIDIPTKKQTNDRLLEDLEKVREARRISRLQWRRQRARAC